MPKKPSKPSPAAAKKKLKDLKATKKAVTVKGGTKKYSLIGD